MPWKFVLTLCLRTCMSNNDTALLLLKIYFEIEYWKECRTGNQVTGSQSEPYCSLAM